LEYFSIHSALSRHHWKRSDSVGFHAQQASTPTGDYIPGDAHRRGLYRSVHGLSPQQVGTVWLGQNQSPQSQLQQSRAAIVSATGWLNE